MALERPSVIPYDRWYNALVMELARSEFIERRENIIALGPSGTGKTHIALGLGLAACQKGMKVRFTTAAALVHELMEAADDKRLLRVQKLLAAQHLYQWSLSLTHGPLASATAWPAPYGA